MRDRGLFLLSSLLVGLLVGCAGPKPQALPAPAVAPASIFVLLPDPDGKAGRIEISNPQGSQILSAAGQATTVKAGEPPSAPITLSDREIAEIFGPALSALPTPPVRFILYFDTGSLELTAESRQLIPQIIASIRERGSVDTSVVGHSDTAGSSEYNYRLSRRRAEAVAQLLAAGGVAPTILEITSHGKDNPAVPTGDNVSEPRNRRVEVTVR